MKHGVIYALCDPRSGEVRYVGKTVRGERRLDDHIAKAATGSTLHVHNWIRSISPSRPSLTVLDGPVPEQWLDALERERISEARRCGYDLCNLTDGGDGGAVIPRDPARAHARRSRATSVNWQDTNYRKKVIASISGLRRSEASRQRYREAAAVRPQEVYDRVGASLRGRPKSAAHRATIRRRRAEDCELLMCECGMGPYIGRHGLGRHKSGGKCGLR